MMADETIAAGSLAPRRTEDRGFDVADLETHGFFDRLKAWIFGHPRWIFVLLRLWPRAGFPVFGWLIVTRFAEVQEVLSRPRAFQVPYGDKTKELNGGPNFLLGLDGGKEYDAYRVLVMKAFRREDVPSLVTPAAARRARDLLLRSGGKIDAVEGLLTRVATFLCEDYYGLRIPDPVEFGHWTIAMSTHIFVDAATVVPAHRRAAEAAARSVRALVDNAIAQAKHASSPPDTVLARLIDIQKAEPAITDEMIRSALIGMITGFVPTNTLAAGNILKVLLSRPDIRAEARAAALAGDDDLLRRCLFEALRFNHIHWGLTRICKEDCTIAAGTARAKRVRPGTKVLASTWAAMFDGRELENPGAFDPRRRRGDYMLFGYDLHWCIGAYIAQAHVTQTFKALLLQTELRPARGKDGEMQMLGDFPQHLWMEFQV